MEAVIRATILMAERVNDARRDGRLPPEEYIPMAEGGTARMTVRDLSPEELAVMGDDALAVAADGANLTFRLLEADGLTLPAETQVDVLLAGTPDAINPSRPPWVFVFIPPADTVDADNA